MEFRRRIIRDARFQLTGWAVDDAGNRWIELRRPITAGPPRGHRIHGSLQHLVLGVRAHDPAARIPLPGVRGGRGPDGRPVRGLHPDAGLLDPYVGRPLAGIRPNVHGRRRRATPDADGPGPDARLDRRLQSTWPACVAVKAAELQGRDPGRRYLRRLREAVLVEGRAIHRRSVQLEAASEAGLGVDGFARALDDGSADRAFHRDLDECRSRNVTGFPTFECRLGLVSLRVDGWQPWEVFEDALRKLDPGLRPRRLGATEVVVLDILRRYPRCATREVAAVLGVTDDETEILLEDLEARGEAMRREAGTGIFWQLSAAILARGATESPVARRTTRL